MWGKHWDIQKTGGLCPNVFLLVDIFENLDVVWEVSVFCNVQTINVSPLKALQTSMLNGENKESHTIFLVVFCWVFSFYIVMLVTKTRKHIRRAYWTKSTWTLCRLLLYCLFIYLVFQCFRSPHPISHDFEEFYSILLNFHWQVLTMSYPINTSDHNDIPGIFNVETQRTLMRSHGFGFVTWPSIFSSSMGGNPRIGVLKPPKWMVKIMENPIKMDDLGIPVFLETPVC